MNFELDPNQQMLAETAEAVAAGLQRRFPAPTSTAGLADTSARAAEVGAEIAELGWSTLLLPAELDGAGATLVEAAIVVSALARHLVPSPVISANLAGVAANDPSAGSLANALAGGATPALAVGQDLCLPPKPGPAIAYGWSDQSDVLLLTHDGVEFLQALPAPVCQDPTVAVAAVTVPDHEPAPAHRRSTIVAAARVLAAAHLAGLAEGALAIARQHALDRYQFGRPIGSFQAVQQMLADGHVDVVASRSVLLGCAWTAAHGTPGEAARASATAFAWCGEATTRSCHIAMQVLGGVGATWEGGLHWYLRSARFTAGLVGGASAALDEIADELVEVAS